MINMYDKLTYVKVSQYKGIQYSNLDRQLMQTFTKSRPNTLNERNYSVWGQLLEKKEKNPFMKIRFRINIMGSLTLDPRQNDVRDYNDGFMST